MSDTKMFFLKAARPAITTVGIGLVGLLLYADCYSRKENKINENFQKTQQFIELDSTYRAQCAAIDTPYVKQRMALEKAYHLQKDSLKQVYINDLAGGK